MSFFNGLKKALGFGGDDLDEDELEGLDARVTPLRQRKDAESIPAEVAPASGEAGDAAAPEAPVAAPEGASESVGGCGVVPDAIFETVVKVFNEALPHFLRESVDEKSQREYLYRMLDSSMKAYLDNLSADARRECSERFDSERRSMQQEMDKLREKAKMEESGSSESKKLQLSAERQKRALTEKLHEVEKQVATLQAENEQYILENKSLLNKLRVSAVTGGSVPTGVEAGDDAAEKAEALSAEIASLKEARDKAEREAKENMMALDSNRRKLTAMTEQWQAENAITAKLREELELALKREESSVATVKELESRMAEAAGKLTDAGSGAEQLEKELSALRSENMALVSERDNLREQLDEANENLRIVDELNEKMHQLEETHRKNEAARRSLKDEVMAMKESLAAKEAEKKAFEEAIALKDNRIRALEDQTDSLRKTIENNIYEHARTEGVLREEIERLSNRRYQLKEETHGCGLAADGDGVAADAGIENAAGDFIVETAAGAVKAEAKPKSRRGRKPKMRISAIDESIADTDWLVPAPPKKGGADSKDGGAEFGYREPERKPSPDHPAQMSLWD